TADLLALATRVRDGVRDAFGVSLHPEPVFVGCSPDLAQFSVHPGGRAGLMRDPL
ncbi:MAG: hypothetical protein QM658_00690, partial [Gordonia sp. (in: high G+C Gram-positive bacteria)]